MAGTSPAMTDAMLYGKSGLRAHDRPQQECRQMRVARRVVALRGPLWPLRAAGPGILDACHRCRSLCGSLFRPPRLAVTAAVAIVPLGVPLGVPLRSAALLW